MPWLEYRSCIHLAGLPSLLHLLLHFPVHSMPGTPVMSPASSHLCAFTRISAPPQPVSASDGMPQAKQQAKQGHSPNRQQAGCLKTPWALNRSGHGPVHQSVHSPHVCAPEQALTHQTPCNQRLWEAASLPSGPVLAPTPASPTRGAVWELLLFFNQSVISDCDPVNWSTPVFCVLHHLPEFEITWASHRQQ